MSENILKDYHSFLLLEKSLSANTILAYENDLSRWFEFIDSFKVQYKDAAVDDVRGFLAELAELGISPRSQSRMLSSLKSFYRFLQYEDLIEENPTDLVEMPKLGDYLPEVLTEEEIDDLVEAIDLSKKEGQRNRAIIETLYGSGLRVSELVNLKLSNIYFEEEYMLVEGKGRKQRLVPLSSICLRQIKLWLLDRNELNIQAGNEDFLYLNRRGAKLTRVMIFTIIKKLADTAGINKNISPHTFRHSFATSMLEGGANLRDIQQLLGHESILTTEIYTHMDVSYLRETVMKYHPCNNRKNM